MGSRAITYFVAAAGVKLQLHFDGKNQFRKSRAANAACKATEENTFLETSKRREVIKFFALKH